MNCLQKTHYTFNNNAKINKIEQLYAFLKFIYKQRNVEKRENVFCEIRGKKHFTFHVSQFTKKVVSLQKL